MLVIKLWLALKKLSLPEFHHFFVIINLGRNYNWAAAHKKTSFHRTSGQTIPRRNRTFDLRCKRWFFFLLISILIFELWLYPCVRTFQGILGCCRRCHKRLQTSEPVTFPTFFVSLQPLAGSALKRKRREKWSSWSETFPNRRETSQWWSQLLQSEALPRIFLRPHHCFVHPLEQWRSIWLPCISVGYQEWVPWTKQLLFLLMPRRAGSKELMNRHWWCLLQHPTLQT